MISNCAIARGAAILAVGEKQGVARSRACLEAYRLAQSNAGTAVTKARSRHAPEATSELASPDLVLTSPEGREVHFKDRSDFVSEASRQIDCLDTVDAIYAFWSRNSAAFGKLRIGAKPGDTAARQLAEALKERVRKVGQPKTNTSNGATDGETSAVEPAIGGRGPGKPRNRRERTGAEPITSAPK